MSNPSKDKGTRAETKVARYLSNCGLETERKALAGSADKGDLRMSLHDGTEIALEVKAGVQTADYNRSLFNKWLEQTVAEGENSVCLSALVIVRYRKPFANTEVWMPNYRWFGHSGWTMMYIDDFVTWMDCWFSTERKE